MNEKKSILGNILSNHAAFTLTQKNRILEWANLVEIRVLKVAGGYSLSKGSFLIGHISDESDLIREVLNLYKKAKESEK
ncbi:hypothetical protein EHQ53_14120 [Leptospira langatensis]|uniref:Uncharacterized protein n=1 Tax=Leptospira langatensis TaxID=2484983 RepID=A0ABY2MDA3_9LEPT|nr:hypothetical protein [Leptospira langatensis]TGL39654.1 hypothetical protein EHQ53_14120 [Leptospira langatensis]